MRITFTVGISLLSDDPSINLIWRHQQHLNRTHGIVLDLDRSGAFQWCAMKLAVVLWDLAFWENATANWNANYGVSLSLHNKLNQLMRLSVPFLIVPRLRWQYPQAFCGWWSFKLWRTCLLCYISCDVGCMGCFETGKRKSLECLLDVKNHDVWVCNWLNQ